MGLLAALSNVSRKPEGFVFFLLSLSFSSFLNWESGRKCKKPRNLPFLAFRIHVQIN